MVYRLGSWPVYQRESILVWRRRDIILKLKPYFKFPTPTPDNWCVIMKPPISHCVKHRPHSLLTGKIWCLSRWDEASAVRFMSKHYIIIILLYPSISCFFPTSWLLILTPWIKVFPKLVECERFLVSHWKWHWSCWYTIEYGVFQN